MAVNSYRVNRRDRASRQQARQAVAEVRAAVAQDYTPQVRRLKLWLAALLLLPAGLITSLAFMEMLWRAFSRSDFGQSEPFVFFLLGGGLWGLAHTAGWRPIHLYVLGHELSHLVVARAFGGKIFGFKVSASGGYVETDKANTWITLAPYLLPFYSLVVLLLFGLLASFLPLHERCYLLALPLRPVSFFYLLLGVTWFFHVTYTVKTIMVHQSDLERNGEFFSIALIFLFNIGTLVLFFIAASPSPGQSWQELARCWSSQAAWLGQSITQIFSIS
jgi:hypothetical protein